MNSNVGGIDRIFRILLGVGLLSVGYYFNNWWGLVGFVPLFTGIFRFCPAYLPFGLNTCKIKRTP